MAEAVLIAGANGAGKTTFARHFILAAFLDAVFLNADEIQREGPLSPLQAGRELIRRMEALVARTANAAPLRRVHGAQRYAPLRYFRTGAYRPLASMRPTADTHGGIRAFALSHPTASPLRANAPTSASLRPDRRVHLLPSQPRRRARSSQCGLTLSIRSIFHWRFQNFSRFSLASAGSIVS